MDDPNFSLSAYLKTCLKCFSNVDMDPVAISSSLGHSWDTWDAGTLGCWDMAKKGWVSENEWEDPSAIVFGSNEKSNLYQEVRVANGFIIFVLRLFPDIDDDSDGNDDNADDDNDDSNNNADGDDNDGNDNTSFPSLALFHKLLTLFISAYAKKFE
ncbi:hypothetical protein C2G38_2182620 [Gigaspora rosea]|uniref:Uncharacterized protein n=1 Tax=Gigaspora rosea TaxID=44941 RepID=A0A397VAU2_9GLOM|nr:hypothetical protein C2G38_2182620 [Gigaspora rosea]